MSVSHVHISTCSHPVRLFNNSTQRFFYVGCGRCPECRHKLQSQWRERIEAEFRAASCTLFVTLTYDNEHLPLVTYDIDNDREVHFVKCNCKYVSLPVLSYRLAPNESIPHFVQEAHNGVATYNKENLLAVHCLQHVTNFFKNCRSYLTYHKYDMEAYGFRYFVVSEYGPRTCRPHYHALLFFRSPLGAQFFQENLLYKKWSYCSPESVVCQSCERAACQYVSKYVSKLCGDCNILNLPQFRVSHRESKSPCFGSCPGAYSLDSISDVVANNGLYMSSYYSTSESSFVVKRRPFPSVLVEQFFPKFIRGSELSTDEFRRVFREVHYYSRKGIELPNYISEVRSLWSNNSCVPSDKIDKPQWSFIASELLSSRNFGYYLFGIPRNRLACKRIYRNFIQHGLSPDDYFSFYLKCQYNKFIVNYFKQNSFYEQYRKEPLKAFMYTFPTFLEDFMEYLPPSLEYMSPANYDFLDLVLSNYALRVEDLYPDGSFISWLSYTSDNDYKEYSTYVSNEKLKHDLRRLANSKYYKT